MENRSSQCVPDIDECAIPNVCSYRCINTVGGFNCTCPSSGYTLGPDGRSCQGENGLKSILKHQSQQLLNSKIFLVNVQSYEKPNILEMSKVSSLLHHQTWMNVQQEPIPVLPPRIASIFREDFAVCTLIVLQTSGEQQAGKKCSPKQFLLS